ncbi:DUF3540 domain-containing protein [Caballeronia zhejiangensis]|uniref:DUF3540 domain-containing protein n=1 Tax=Caballeronia zhejiangensis TaxID=871203 RepID=UPI00158E972C|nr:DUF3540 domain-containing protein [Caballeronia zhejiangensis]
MPSGFIETHPSKFEAAHAFSTQAVRGSDSRLDADAYNRVGWDTGRIILAHASNTTVQLESGDIVSARLAAGTLMVPQKGDLVIVFGDTRARYWITQILSFDSSQQPTRELSVQGATRLLLKAPMLELHAAQTLDLHAQAMRANTEEASFSATRATLRGSHLIVISDCLSYVARIVQSVASHVVQRAKTRSATIEQTDRLDAQRICAHGEQSVELSGDTVEVNASGPLFLDGERVLVS